MEGVAQITLWRPVTSVANEPYFASFVFEPTLAQILKFSHTVRARCRVSLTGLYDGDHNCVIDKIAVDAPQRAFRESPRLYYVATLGTRWSGNPQDPGVVKFFKY